MASSPTPDPQFPPVKLDPLAALLSFLIPGLGQVYQGRVGKGLLFFGGLYLLFFYGMWMGEWQNVWIPDATNLPDVILDRDENKNPAMKLEGFPKAISYRWQFAGQFWIGVAAWPAVYQYSMYDSNKESAPIFGKFERAPKEEKLNELQRNGNKRWDLAWVYTVIAGVLNLLVIYDALAGPMFREPLRQTEEAEAAKASAPAPQAAAPPAPHAPPPAPPAPHAPQAPAPPVPAAPAVPTASTPPTTQQGGA